MTAPPILPGPRSRRGSSPPRSAKRYLRPTSRIPTDGIVKQTADEITVGADHDLEKAQRIYEWIVVNTFREPKVRGCGLGDISFMLQTGNLGGKCADLNALFVGSARAIGVPARDIYGIRVAPSPSATRASAGTPSSPRRSIAAPRCISTAYGWVPMDPADVRKVMLEEPPGNLAGRPQVVPRAQGCSAAGRGTGWPTTLPRRRAPRLGGAESAFPDVSAGRNRRGNVDCLDAAAFDYVITAREITA